jgi:hypothetical protein
MTDQPYIRHYEDTHGVGACGMLLGGQHLGRMTITNVNCKPCLAEMKQRDDKVLHYFYDESWGMCGVALDTEENQGTGDHELVTCDTCITELQGL